jgi:hypothetical protein
MKAMARSKIGTQLAEHDEERAIGMAREEILADGFDDYADQIEDALDEETDFDVEDDIAVLGEEYDVLEFDDVLELCNLDKRKSFRN